MKTLIELEGSDCRFPFGDNAPFLFCAEVQQPGSSFCEFHHRMCWDRVVSKPAKARVYQGTNFAA